MPKYYHDSRDGGTLIADTPEQEALAESDKSLVPLIDETDTPFQRPVEFKDKQTGETLKALSKKAYDLALLDRGLDLITTPTPSEAFAAAREERAKLENKIRREASSFGEQIADSTLATLYGFGGTMLPGIFPAIRELGGATPEEQEVFRREYSVASGLGTLAGIGGQIAATGGMGAAARTAGATAAAETAAAGGGRIAQGLAAARAAGSIPLTAGEAVAAPLGVGTRVGEAVRAGLTAVAPAAAETVLGKTVLGATAAAASALPLAAAYEFDESNLENRAMSSEAVFHNVAMTGLLGATEGLAPLLKGIGTSETGQKLASSLGKSQAMRLMNRFDKGFLAKASKQLRSGPEGVIKRINSAIDQGYIGLGKSAAKSSDDIARGLEENGAIIGQLADEAIIKNVGKQDLTPMLEKLSDEVIAPMMGPGTTVAQDELAAIPYLSKQLDIIREKYPSGIDASDLARIRTQISDVIYRDMRDPTKLPATRKLREMRDIMTDELGKIFESAGIDKRIWKRAQEQYGVLSTAEDLIERGIIKEAQKVGISDAAGAAGGALAYVGGMIAAAAGEKPWQAVDPWMAALAAAGGFVAKRGGVRAYDWAQGALRRAIESGAPESTIINLKQLNEQQAAAAADALAGISVAPENEARAHFWRLSHLIDNASRDPYLSPAAIKAVRVAQNEMSSFSGGRMVGLRSVARASPNDLATELEKAQDALSSAARITAKNKPTEADVAILRTIRDEINGTLADAGLWGPERAEKAREFYQNLIASRIDPVRVAALEGLDEATRNLRIKTTSKVDRLFSESAPRRTLTLAPTMSEAYGSERRRFKERVFKHHFEEKKEE